MNNKQGANQWSDPKEKIDHIEKLLARPMTKGELIKASGFSSQTICKYLKVLHEGTPKRVFVCGYRSGKTTNTKVYWAGNLPDAQRPLTKKEAEKLRNQAKREEKEDDRPREPAQVVVHRDPLHAALFGAPRRTA